MARFARPEPVEGSDAVALVWDEPHAVYRARREVKDPDPGLAARVRAVARVKHPNLVKLVAVAEEPGRVQIVTEWLSGAPVRGLAPVDAVRAFVHVLGGLDALHDAGLAHGGELRLLTDGLGRTRLYRAGLVDGTAAADLRAFGDLVLRATRPPIPTALQKVAHACREGRYADADAVQAALKDAREALAARTAAPVVRAEHAEEDDQMRLGWLLVALLPALILVVGAAVLGGLRGFGPPW